MSEQHSHDTSNIRAVMQPRRPAGVGKIEKARDPRRAMKGLLRYLAPFKAGRVQTAKDGKRGRCKRVPKRSARGRTRFCGLKLRQVN
jgi:hypothetical protein